MAFIGDDISYMDYHSDRGYNNYGRYNRGSEAYDLDIKKAIEIEEKRQLDLARKHKQQVRERRERIVNIRHTIRLLFAVGVVFVGCVLTITAVSSVAQMRYKITELKEDLSVIQNENIVLASEISDTINLDYIEDRAINELGMSKPQAYQIRTISVPEQSYTVQYKETEDVEPQIDTEILKEFFFKG